jgi:hypothetical protein
MARALSLGSFKSITKKSKDCRKSVNVHVIRTLDKRIAILGAAGEWPKN